MRHPLYLSLILAGFGWALIWASAPAAGATIALALLLRGKAAVEERLLLRKFPGSALFVAIISSFLIRPSFLPAQAPALIHYQGRVLVSNLPFNGSGHFKFALINGGIPETVTCWSNDGASEAGATPDGAVALPVQDGLFSVLLGNDALDNMTAVPPTIFAQPDVRLRVWFSQDGNPPFRQLGPDQRIASVGYAMRAATAASIAVNGELALRIEPSLHSPNKSAGMATWTGTGNVLYSSGGRFDNEGTFLIQTDADWSPPDNAATGVFNNSGILRKNTATGKTLLGPSPFGVATAAFAFENTGMVFAELGTLAIAARFSQRRNNLRLRHRQTVRQDRRSRQPPAPHHRHRSCDRRPDRAG